jgi:CotH protein.
MSGKGKTLIRIAVTGILFLLLSGSACALKERTLTAGCPSVCGETVTARWSGENMILSLPGNWDLTRITLEMEDTDVLQIRDASVTVPAGAETDLSGLTGTKIPLWDGEHRSRGTVTILQGSEIPALFLHVDAKELKKVNRSKENVITEGRAVYTEADGTVSCDGELTQLKGRGNDTFRYSKKPYQFKLKKKASLSGMGAAKTWVLLANWVDVSLLRNRIVLDMSREIGLKNAVGCVPADVWINGAYQGLYLLTEKIQIGKERIPIADLEEETEKANAGLSDPGKMKTERSGTYPLLRSYPALRDPEDITGGYIMTVEKTHRLRDNVLAGFRTKDGLSIRIKEPTAPSRAQAEYLFGRITEMQHALMNREGTAPETGKSYREYLDTASFARKFLIEDWCKNYDFLGGSQYLYKDSDRTDPLIYAGPSWDYDLSFGNMKKAYSAAGRYVTVSRKNANLYWLLYGHADFREELRQVWTEVFRPAAAVLLGEKEGGGALRSLEEYRAEIERSAAMNYRRWPVSRNANGEGSGGDFDHAFAYLKKWIAERTAWMDGEYGPEKAAE